jgi:hypothetical protein
MSLKCSPPIGLLIPHDAERSQDDAAGFFGNGAVAARLLAGEGSEDLGVAACARSGTRRRLGARVAGQFSRSQATS